MVSLRSFKLPLWLIALTSAIALAESRCLHFPSLAEATLEDLTMGLEKGKFNTVDLVQTYLKRIEEVNSIVHAVTEINPDALKIAKLMDLERKNNIRRGPLHGIPILLKNNIATHDEMNNTAGSFVLLGATVPRDSTVASKLRKAGAVLLGKANLSQWANFRSNNTPDGWSAHGGQIVAAYHLNQDPSGSSGGSGVATDLGLAFASIGTDTRGSILYPAHRSAVVGIRPTLGLVSRDLVIPISEHQDTVGPLARTVTDAARILQVIAGKDSADNYTSAIPMIPDYTSACRLGSLRGARIGVPWNVIALELESNANEPERAALAEEIRAFHESLKVMKTFGTTIIDAEFSMARELKNSPHEARICLADYIVNLPSYLDKLSYNPADVHTLNDVRNWTKSHGCIEDYPRRNTYIWDMALGETGELPYNNTDPKFWEAYQELQHLGGPGGLLGALDRHRLSAVILPTSIAARYAAVVGAPVITVPLGYYSDNMQLDTRFGTVLSGPGIPFGLSFLGKPWGERDLIGLAFDFEQRTMVRRKGKPLIRPRAEISTCT